MAKTSTIDAGRISNGSRNATDSTCDDTDKLSEDLHCGSVLSYLELSV